MFESKLNAPFQICLPCKINQNLMEDEFTEESTTSSSYSYKAACSILYNYVAGRERDIIHVRSTPIFLSCSFLLFLDKRRSVDNRLFRCKVTSFLYRTSLVLIDAKVRISNNQSIITITRSIEPRLNIYLSPYMIHGYMYSSRTFAQTLM
jgi:hypothetical protein